MRALFFASVLNITPLTWAQLSKNVFVPNEEFVASLNKPNATSRYPIDGFDVTQRYPFNEAADSIDGWYLEFNASIMSAANSEDDMFLPKDGYVAGASLKVVPPPELALEAGGGIKGVDKSWHVCLTEIYYDQLPKETIERGKTDDGSCFQMFGEECAQALLSAYSTAASSIGSNSADFNTFTGCAAPKNPPPACDGVFFDQGLLQGFGQLGLDDEGFGKTNQYQWGSKGFKDKANTTEYDLLGGLSHPVIISWGFNRTVANGVQQVRYAGTTMRCVRAVNATAGSTAPSPPISQIKDDGKGDDNGDKDGEQNNAPGPGNNNNNGNGNAAGKIAGLGGFGTMVWGLSVALLVALTC
ncbi:hypothetical protein V8F06_004422 [Rhypophila decipiens]